MISNINALTVNGLESNLIEVEVDINNWLPSFTIVGLPDQSVQESKERLRSALKASSSRLPASRITVNLAPANIKKSGPSFDFPIAIGILLANGEIEENYIEDSVFLWELSLSWDLRSITSVLPATIWAKDLGFKRIFLPEKNVAEAAIIPGIDIISVKNLCEVIAMLNGEKELKIVEQVDFSTLQQEQDLAVLQDMKYIVGQNHAKKALEIAASWGHNIIMSGPPGSGKTMLAKAFSSILPDLNLAESIEVSKIYSITGLLTNKNPLVLKRPFRTVHHTASSVSIIGWGRNAKPGEISLAHKGVLFLDEILEFQKSVLEVLRQPLEDGKITVNRVNASFTYPAQFILVWAMNPCPCGYLTDPDKECICSQRQIQNYSGKLSGPLVDRVDIFIEVPKVKTDELKLMKDYSHTETSKQVKERVEKARNLQLQRFKGTRITFNSEMGTKEINIHCKLDSETEAILQQAVNMMNLSARSYYRILKLARTIADLEASSDIQQAHILEALSYRKKEAN